jgi:hypothetical protein
MGPVTIFTIANVLFYYILFKRDVYCAISRFVFRNRIELLVDFLVFWGTVIGVLLIAAGFIHGNIRAIAIGWLIFVPAFGIGMHTCRYYDRYCEEVKKCGE